MSQPFQKERNIQVGVFTFTYFSDECYVKQDIEMDTQQDNHSQWFIYVYSL